MNKPFKIGDRVFFKRWDGYSNREDRGLGHIEKAGKLGVNYYIIKFDKEVNHKDHDTFYERDFVLFNDKDKRNCPKCYERMESKFSLHDGDDDGCYETKIYQCPFCKNIESV
jgi:DNA-directed RNA polymerase subunit M/transcription elongation factor TFIIS